MITLDRVPCATFFPSPSPSPNPNSIHAARTGDSKMKKCKDSGLFNKKLKQKIDDLKDVQTHSNTYSKRIASYN